jgi:1-acyl-sn-glycerol-3-phosphate acyltransferase
MKSASRDQPQLVPGRLPRSGGGDAVIRWAVRGVLAVYMRVWHRLEAHGLEHLPPAGPLLVLTNHGSLLDVPALIVASPYSNCAVVVKAALFANPLLRVVLRAWGAVPVARDGRDFAGLHAVLEALRAGRVVAIAAEGRRTRTGRMQPVHPTVVRLAMSAAVPILPVGIAGSHVALPPGKRLPRPRRVTVRAGRPFRLPSGISAELAGRQIQSEILALLPPTQWPDQTPP